MGLVRMFHYTCDAGISDRCKTDSPGEYYSKVALQQAKKFGWVLRGELSLCPACYEAGARIVTSAIPQVQGKFRIRLPRKNDRLKPGLGSKTEHSHWGD